MKVSFVSLLNCNQFGWWVEEEDKEPPPPSHPTLTVSCEEFCILAFLPRSELWRVQHSCFPSSQWAMKSSAFLLSFLTVSCEEFYILACSLFTLAMCGKPLYCSAAILRSQGFSLVCFIWNRLLQCALLPSHNIWKPFHKYYWDCEYHQPILLLSEVFPLVLIETLLPMSKILYWLIKNYHRNDMYILYTYVYMYVCSHAWAYMYVCGDINTHITHMYLYMYVSMDDCMYVCIHAISMYTVRYVYRKTSMSLHIYRHLCMYIHTLLHMCIHTYVHVYVCICCKGVVFWTTVSNVCAWHLSSNNREN